MDKGRKPNELIQAGQNLTSIQLKALLGMLSKFKYDVATIDTQEKQLELANVVYKIPLSELLPAYESTRSGNVIKRAREQIEALMKQTITIETEERLVLYNLVSSSVIDKGTTEITAKFNYDIIPVLVNMVEKGYTEMSLTYIRQLKSAYSIRIYELLLKNHRLNHVILHGYKIEVDHLRYLLGLEEGKYKNFADFKKRVLVQADTEINSDKTNLRYKYDVIRSGRKVTHIHFKDISLVEPHKDEDGDNVGGVEQAVLPLEKDNPLRLINKSDARKIQAEHSEEYIQYYYKRSRRLEREGVIKSSFEGFFYKQLIDDPKDFYHLPKNKPVKTNAASEETSSDLQVKRIADEAKVLFNELSPEERKRRITEVKNVNLFMTDEMVETMAAFDYLNEVEQTK